MSGPSPQSLRACARATPGLAIVFALVAGLLGVFTPSVRANEDAPVRVVLDRLTPVVPTAGDELRIRGRVVNNTNNVINSVSVRLRLSAQPLTSRGQITLVRNSPLDTENPARNLADDTDIDPYPEPTNVTLDATTVNVAESIAPRSQSAFTIRIPFSNLPLRTNGVYALAIEARAAKPGQSVERQGIVRTFLPWFTEPIDPVELVWLWPLADWPTREANGVFLDDQTPRAISPQGRLTQIVESAGVQPRAVSWFADPALLQAVRDMSTGYQVQRGGQVVVGDRSTDAQSWLSTLNTTLARSQPIGSSDPVLRVLPYADIDASAVNRAGMPTDVVRAITQAVPIGSSALGQQVSGGVYWAPFGRLDKETADLLASAGVRTVIVSGSWLRAQDAYAGANTGRTTLSTSFGGLQAVLREPRMSALLTEPQRTRSDAILIRQAFLAESGILAGTIPTDAQSRAIVVGPDDVRWDPSPTVVNALLRATVNAPWLRPLTLNQLLDAPGNSLRRERGDYGSRAVAAELDAGYLAQVRTASGELAAFTNVLDNPIGISDAFASALLRTESSAWRSQPDTGQALLNTVRSQLSTQMNQVRVLSVGTLTFSGDTGRIPVTIENNLDRSVTVGVDLRATPAIRLESEPLTGITVEPGRLASVDIEARVVGGTTLPVRVQLLTPDGAPFATPARIEVESTAYARAAAWVVAIAFVAIVIFVVVGVIRRIRLASSSDAGSGAEHE